MTNPMEAYVSALEKMSTDPKEIDDLRSNDPLGLFVLGCQVLLNEEASIELASAALASIARIFVPSVINTVESLTEMFNNYNEETKEMILSALTRGLLMDDESVRNQSAFTLANVFRLNLKEWENLFERLDALMKQSDASELHFAGVLTAFKEFFAGNFIRISFRKFKNSSSIALNDALLVLSQEVSEETKIIALKLLATYFKNFKTNAISPPIEGGNQHFFDVVFEQLAASESAMYFREILITLYHFYQIRQNEVSFGELVKESAGKVIEISGEILEDVEKHCAFLNFLAKVVKLCGNFSYYSSELQEIYDAVIEDVVSVLDAAAEEDLSNFDEATSIRQTAANLILEFIKSIGKENEEIQEAVINIFSERLASDDLSTVKGALLLFKSIAKIANEELLGQAFTILQTLTECEDDEARMLAYTNLRYYITRRGKDLSDEEYGALLQLTDATIERDSEDDKMESLNVLCTALMLRSKYETVNIIGTNFNQFNEVIQKFLASEKSTEMVKIQAFKTLGFLVYGLPIQCDDEVGGLVETYCGLFEQETDDNMKDQFASIINTLIYRNQTAAAPYFEHLIEVFMSVLSPEELKFEEVIKAIEAIVLASGEEIAGLFESIWPILEAFINSGQTNFASSAAHCLGTFFRVTGIQLSERVPEMLLFLLARIRDTYSQSDLQIAFLNSLSDVLVTIKRFVDENPGDFPEEINFAKSALKDFSQSIPILAVTISRKTLFEIIKECLLCATRFAEIYTNHPEIMGVLEIVSTLFDSIIKECKNVKKLNNNFLNCVLLLVGRLLDNVEISAEMFDSVQDGHKIKNKLIALCNKRIVKTLIQESMERKDDESLTSKANSVNFQYRVIK